MLKNLFWKLCNKLNQYIAKPRMIMGYRSCDGIYLPNTRISNTTLITDHKSLNLEDNIFISHHSIIESSNGITIQEGCQICAYVSLLSHSSHIAIRLYGKHYIENNTRHLGYVRGQIKIGKYTFIGPYSTVMPDSTIGKGSIIKAYSFVKGNFPDFAIIAGNPAIVVGDSRDIDSEYLEKHPELKAYYDEWSSNS